tara:strand:- start:147 stop:1436 length:1290 start_codon:yes stop_codon:yes gene_type:complete
MKPTVTLCMIVKDETHIIEQCLKSMAKYIDRYDITDTGSTDGTQDLIKKTMKELGVPGEVHQSDWKGFGDHNGKIGSRTESFVNAKNSGADYAWVIDADDYIEGNFKYPENMNRDAYAVKMGRSEFSWWRNQIFKMEHVWKYVGVLHEYADCDSKPREELNFDRIMGDYRVIARTEGNRNVGVNPIDKYKRDAEVLEKALEDEPKNERYWFYLAQSYFDSQQWEKALEAYTKRVEIGGWPEEVYYSLLRCAIVKGVLNKPMPEVAQAFLDCFNARPIRAEPLWFLARLYRMNDKPAIGYLYARMAAEIPYPENDILFIQDEIYHWGILDEIGATAFYAGQPLVGQQATLKLLNENLAPREHMERIQNNAKSYEQVVQQMQQQMKEQQVQKEMQNIKEKEEKKERKNSKEKKPTKMAGKKGYKKRSKQKV